MWGPLASDTCTRTMPLTERLQRAAAQLQYSSQEGAADSLHNSLTGRGFPLRGLCSTVVYLACEDCPILVPDPQVPGLKVM